MNTTLYRIPNKYFPTVKVIRPFHAKVNYEVKQGKVVVSDVALSAQCLKYITGTDKFIEELRENIEAAEKNKAGNNINPLIKEALAPFTQHIPY